MAFQPKIRLLFYENVIDLCLVSFFNDYVRDFSRTPDGKYSFSCSRKSIEKYFTSHITEEISKRIQAFDITNPVYTFIIGGCNPPENIMLDYRTGYFPEKLMHFVTSRHCQKYMLKETDISIDMAEFNEIFDSIFIDAFRHGFTGIKNAERGVFAIMHRRLDCYAIFKIIKYLYGRTNCINIWKEEGGLETRCIISVNSLIDKYVNNKTAMNKSREFKQIVSEVKQYADEKIRGC